MTVSSSNPESLTVKSSKLKGYVFFGIKIFFTLAIMAVIFYKIPVSDVLRKYQNIHVKTVIQVFAWLLLGFVLSAWRWFDLVKAIYPKAIFSKAMRGLMLERFLNQALPTTIGGDVARAYGMVSSEFSFSKSILSVIMDRVYALLGLGIFVLMLTAPLFYFFQNKWIVLMIFLFVSGIVTVGLLGLYLPLGWLQYVINRIRKNHSQKLQKLLDLRRLYSNKKSLFLFNGIILTIAVHLAQLRGFQLLAIELGAPTLSYWQIVVLVTPAFFLATIPISVSGWGLREVGVIFMLAQLGISTDISAASSILFGLLFALFGVFCGLIYMLWSIVEKIITEN